MAFLLVLNYSAVSVKGLNVHSHALVLQGSMDNEGI